MTTYLQFDGSTNYLTIPNLIYTRFVIDFAPTFNGTNQYYLDNTNNPYSPFIKRQSTGIDQYGNTWFGGYVNGSATKSANNSTWFTSGTRYTFDITGSAMTTGNTAYIFTDKSATYFLGGNLYDLKFYNGSTLICHIDLTTGTLTDQTGNGNNAVNHGATFVGGTSGTTYNGSGLSQGQSSASSHETLILKGAGIAQGNPRATSNETLVSASTTYSASGTAQGNATATSTEKIILSASGTSQAQPSAISSETLISQSGTTFNASSTASAQASASSSETLILSGKGTAQGNVTATSQEHLSLSASGIASGQANATSTETFIAYQGSVYSASGTATGHASLTSSETMSRSASGMALGNASASSRETAIFYVTGISQAQASATSKDRFISVLQIVSHVTLKGSRELHVILEGSRELHVVLQGGVDMPAENQNFTLEAGTDKIIDIPGIVDNIASLDLTSCTEIHYEAKRGANIISKDLTNGIVVTSPTDLSITLVPADSHLFVGNFHHEVWCIDSNNKKTVLMTGSLTIVPSYADTTA